LKKFAHGGVTMPFWSVITVSIGGGIGFRSIAKWSPL